MLRKPVTLSIVTDSYSLFNLVVQSSTTTDRRLMIDIQAGRDAHKERSIDNMGWVKSDGNLADGLNEINKPDLIKLVMHTVRLDKVADQWVICTPLSGAHNTPTNSTNPSDGTIEQSLERGDENSFNMETDKHKNSMDQYSVYTFNLSLFLHFHRSPLVYLSVNYPSIFSIHFVLLSLLPSIFHSCLYTQDHPHKYDFTKSQVKRSYNFRITMRCKSGCAICSHKMMIMLALKNSLVLLIGLFRSIK